MPTLLSQLKRRGCIHDSSSFQELEELLERQCISFYCGFDPTGTSLHVGHLLPLVLMRRMQKAGHKPIAVVGSATGMIGDPSGKCEERALLSEEQIEANSKKIEKQIQLFLSAEGDNAYLLVNNADWLRPLGYIEFLRDIGKHFSVNAMLAKDSVRLRLESRDQGISYTEFSYQLLQAYDFYWLYRNCNCRLQVGGSDQWGNITAGLELIRRLMPAPYEPAYALTFPLITASSGAKFGKTEKGAVWLDPARTSPYLFYQYWMNVADADVIHYLSLFTDTDEEMLADLAQTVREKPEQRTAQKKLAWDLTTLVHGETEALQAVQASKVLFGERIANVSSTLLMEIFSDVPSVSLSIAELDRGKTLQDLMVLAGLADSNSAARRLIESGGVYVNNEKAASPRLQLTLDQFIDGSLLVLRSGKKNYRLIRLA
jgi:tyrosyl-tRNA synthetase